MPEPIDDLRELIGSPEFEAVHAAVLALDPSLLINPDVGAHFGALRTGLLGVVAHMPPLPEPEPEPVEYEDNPPAEEPPADEPSDE